MKNFLYLLLDVAGFAFLFFALVAGLVVAATLVN